MKPGILLPLSEFYAIFYCPGTKNAFHANPKRHVIHLRQQCHNSKYVIFQEKILKVLKFYNVCECNDDTADL